MIILIFLFITSNLFSQTNYLPNSHSHNDYNNEKPLETALENGFASIEADVFYLEDDKQVFNYIPELFVAHDFHEIDSTRTLKSLYLEPLLKLYKEKGFIYRNNELILLIDFKSEAEKTFKVLNEILKEYKEILTYRKGEIIIKKSIRIIISGSRPIETIKKMNETYCFVDGRISDLGKNIPDYIMPLISNSFTHFLESDNLTWDLTEIVKKVHSEKKIFRLWGVPDNEKYWSLQLTSGCDLIGTDKIKELADFLIFNRDKK